MNHIATLPDLQDARDKAGAASLGYGREAIAFLGMSRLGGVGFHTLMKLGGRRGISELLESKSVAEVERCLSTAGARLGRGVCLPQGWDEFRQQLWHLGQESARPLIARGIRFLFSDDDAFPSRLARMPEVLRPHWIFVAGELGLLERPSLAIVGTRDASETGSFLSRYAVSCAAELGAPVVSGLAHGIDRLVHEWCLHVSLPTISVLGTGILINYPARHAPLSEAILAAGGALVSEYLPDQEPSGQQFVWRNRLQAALGCATIPVEWKQKSGTAHTVRFSRTLERPVFGLDLVGVPRAVGAGKGDQNFVVPSEHENFIDALRKHLLAAAAKPDQRQGVLFN
jgi:DNA processing protein